MNAGKLSAFRAHLRESYGELRSWRKVAAGYPGVNHETLRRIARTDYLPKDRRILRALGLVTRGPRTEIQKRISKMVRATRKALLVK